MVASAQLRSTLGARVLVASRNSSTSASVPLLQRSDHHLGVDDQLLAGGQPRAQLADSAFVLHIPAVQAPDPHVDVERYWRHSSRS